MNNIITKNFPSSEVCPQGDVVNSPQWRGGSEADGVVLSPLFILTTINQIPIYRNFVQNLPFNPRLKQLAKDKRKAGILSEVLFWQQVHKRIFHKIDFDRQRIIGNYIVDFYVKTLGLIIEIDGSSHNNKEEYDAKRQQYLENLGLTMYRIPDSAVKSNIGIVMQQLEYFIVNQYSSPNSSPPEGW